MKQINENTFYRIYLVMIFLLFISLEILLHVKGFYSISADDSSHTLQAYSWFKNCTPLYSVWLPFQRIINGTALYFYYDLLVTPRITSFLFGLISLSFLMILSKTLFENKTVVIFTGLLGAISVPLVIFGAVPMMEIYFLAFVLISLTFYFRWAEKKKRIYLWCSIAAAGIGNTTRYEAWLFSFFLFGVIAYEIIIINKEKMKLSFLLIAGFLLASFPLYWIYLSSVSTGSAGMFVASVSSRYHPETFIDRVKDNVLYIFLSINLVSANLFGVISLFSLSKQNPKVKSFNIIFWGTLLCFSIVSFVFNTVPSHNQWRVAMIWSLLLIPFTAYWLYYLYNTFSKSNFYKILIGIFALLIVLSFLLQINSYSSLSYMTREDIQVGKYTRQLFQSNNASKIFIVRTTTDKWRYVNVLVTSQNPDNFIASLEKSEHLTSDTLHVDSGFISAIKTKNVGYILLPPYIIVPDATDYLNELMRNNTWVLYKIKDTPVE